MDIPNRLPKILRDSNIPGSRLFCPTNVPEMIPDSNGGLRGLVWNARVYRIGLCWWVGGNKFLLLGLGRFHLL